MEKSFVSVVSCSALVLMLGLVACGGSSSSASVPEASSSTPSTSSSPDEPTKTLLGRVKAEIDNAKDEYDHAKDEYERAKDEHDRAKAEYDRAIALYDEGKFYSAKQAFESSAYGDWEQRAAACVQPMPETGELFHDPDMRSDKMILNFTVEEIDDNQGTFISVYTKDKKLVETLFIRGVGTVETWLPGGDYYVKDSSGSEWYGEDEQFGPDGHYESMVFNEVEGDRYLAALAEGYQWDITINATAETGQSVASEEGSWDSR